MRPIQHISLSINSKSAVMRVHWPPWGWPASCSSAPGPRRASRWGRWRHWGSTFLVGRPWCCGTRTIVTSHALPRLKCCWLNNWSLKVGGTRRRQQLRKSPRLSGSFWASNKLSENLRAQTLAYSLHGTSVFYFRHSKLKKVVILIPFKTCTSYNLYLIWLPI